MNSPSYRSYPTFYHSPPFPTLLFSTTLRLPFSGHGLITRDNKSARISEHFVASASTVSYSYPLASNPFFRRRLHGFAPVAVPSPTRAYLITSGPSNIHVVLSDEGLLSYPNTPPPEYFPFEDTPYLTPRTAPSLTPYTPDYELVSQFEIILLILDCLHPTPPFYNQPLSRYLLTPNLYISGVADLLEVNRRLSRLLEE